MTQVVWTPDASEMGLGTVILSERPKEPLTQNRWEAALADRINRLAAKASPEELDAARDLVFSMEQIDLPRNPGFLLLEESSELRNKSGMNATSWPVPVRAIQQEPDKLEALEEETLLDFLETVYG